jgi:hypothetical protein
MVRNQFAAPSAAVHRLLGFPLGPHQAGPGAIAKDEHLEVAALGAGNAVIALVALQLRQFDAADALTV